jgi:hypothetical protein
MTQHDVDSQDLHIPPSDATIKIVEEHVASLPPNEKTTREKLDELWRAVFGIKIGETKEPGLLNRIKRIEMGVRYAVAAFVFLILHDLGVPTDKLIDLLKAWFALITGHA